MLLKPELELCFACFYVKYRCPLMLNMGTSSRTASIPMTYLLPAVSDRHPQLKSTSLPLVCSTTRLQNLSGKLFRGPHSSPAPWPWNPLQWWLKTLERKGLFVGYPYVLQWLKTLFSSQKSQSHHNLRVNGPFISTNPKQNDNHSK